MVDERPRGQRLLRAFSIGLIVFVVSAGAFIGINALFDKVTDSPLDYGQSLSMAGAWALMFGLITYFPESWLARRMRGRNRRRRP